MMPVCRLGLAIMTEKITSFQNTKLKLIKKLRDKKGREEEGLFVIDSARDLERAIACGYQARFWLYCPQKMTPEDVLLAQQLPSSKGYEVTPDILAKAAYRDNPSGLLAVLDSPPTQSLIAWGQSAHVGDCVLVLVGLTKPGNIGALLRTADAGGIAAIWLIDSALDLYNPNIIRSSTGACFLGNIYTGTSAQALQQLEALHYQIVAAHPDAEKTIYDVAFAPTSAIVLGTEDTGLPQTWLDACHIALKIPMRGRLSDSLNVSVSGAIFMYEVLRQQQFVRSQ